MFCRQKETPVLILGLCLAAGQAAPATADTLRVPGQFPTIQAAMDAAQPGDTVLVADGVYTGPGNRGLFFAGKAITVRSENGPESCVIDCQGAGLAFWFVADETPKSLVQGFTIVNGRGGSGGAVFLHHDSSPTFIDCVFVNNSAVTGGAIHCETTSRATFIRCTIRQNTANFGGGVSVVERSAPRFINCLIAENNASIDGGGIFSSPFNTSTRLTHSTISDNLAGRDGGSVFVGSGSAKIAGCTIGGNVAGESGGGLAVRGPGNVGLENTILWDDSAPMGAELALHTHPNLGGATVGVAYSDVQGGQAGAAVQPGSVLNWGAGNIDLDPRFVNPAAGDYHLAGDSPCVNAGDPAFEPQPGETDIDGDPRVICFRVDIGSDEFVLHGDLDCDGDVDLTDFTAFQLCFGGSNNPPGPNCPKGVNADLDNDGDVDLVDFLIFQRNFTGSL